MRLYQSIFLLLLLLSFSLLVKSQTVEELFKIAEDANPELKAIENEYQAILQKIPQVNQLPDPEVGLGVAILPVETRVGPQWIRGSAMQLFPWFGTLEANEQLVLQQAEAKRQQMDIIKNRLLWELKNNWYQLYELQKSKQVEEENRSILATFKELALIKIEAGKGSVADVLRVEMETNELNTKIAILEEKITPLQANINRILNRDLATLITIPDHLATPFIPLTKDSITALIKTQNPQLQQLQLQQAVAEQNKRVQELKGKPTIGAGLDYVMITKRKDVTDLSRNGRDVLMPKVSVKIPLYKSKNAARVKQVEYEQLAIANQAQSIENQLLAQLEKGFTDYQIAQRQAELYHQQLALAQQTLDLIITTYSVDGRNFEEVLRIQKEIVAYKVALVKTAHTMQTAVAFIESLYYATPNR